MTEAEWLDPLALKMLLLAHVAEPRYERKLRLFACACLRRAANVVSPLQAEWALCELEEYAEGRGTEDARIRVWHGDFPLSPDADDTSVELLRSEFRDAARKTIRHSAKWLGHSAANAVAVTNPFNSPLPFVDEEDRQVAFLRDIFGNPFRPVAFDPAWRTTDVTLLASGIYEECAFGRMPILADALQDAGCDSDALLNHLRDPHVTHVRGCWALDLVLGKG